MPVGSRIAMLPKQRYKQEQRLMMLNADSIVNTYPPRQLQQFQQQLQRAASAAITGKRNCSSQSTEEGFDEEFTSLSEDELLILPFGPPTDDDAQNTLALATQVF